MSGGRETGGGGDRARDGGRARGLAGDTPGGGPAPPGDDGYPGFDGTQARVLRSRKNFAVVAGAGSGKTHTLVEYVVNHIGEDPQNRPITSILALTFTDKAATEMRDRIAKSIMARLAEARDKGDRKGQAVWEKASRGISQAEIGTIHSYALGLLTRNSQLLGLPRGLSIEEDDLGAQIDQTIADLAHERDGDLASLLRELPLKRERGASLAGWLSAALDLVSSWGLEGLRPAPPGQDAPTLLAGLERLAREIRDIPKSAKEGTSLPKWRDGAGGVLGILGRLDGFERIPNIAVAREIMGHRPMFNRGPAALVNTREAMKGAIDSLFALSESAAAAPLVAAFCSLCQKISLRARASRMKKGTLLYDDILFFARKLLSDFPHLRKEEAAKWGLILIDEFQDTNRLQADILALILSPGDDGAPHFQDLDFRGLPPKLRVIGDPKQSIYRFRGAEPSIMNDLAQRLGGQGGELLSLGHNYRSQRDLVAFHNLFFPGFLDEPYEAQGANRENLYPGRKVVLAQVPRVPPESGRRQRKLGAEGNQGAIVSYIRELLGPASGVRVGAGEKAGKGGGVPEKGAPRPPRCGDVAILLRRKANSLGYQRALLAEGWPCQTLKGRDLARAPEIKGLLAAYLYLCGRSADINLALAILSPLGPVSEGTLATLCLPGALAPQALGPRPRLSDWFRDLGFGFPEAIPGPERDALSELRSLFLSLSPYVRKRPAGEIMECLMEARDLLPLVIAGEGGSAGRAQDLQFFLAKVKNEYHPDPSAPQGVPDLLTHTLLSGSERGESEGDDPGAGPEGGAINIMTVHKAKGLEAPIVIVPEADHTAYDTDDGIRINEKGEVALHYNSRAAGGEISSAGYKSLKDDAKALSGSENKRLLYVAATRARDHLAFIGLEPSRPKGPDEAKSWFDQLQFAPSAQGASGHVEIVRLEAAAPSPEGAPAEGDGPKGQGEGDPPSVPAPPAQAGAEGLLEAFGGFDPRMVEAPPLDGHLSLSVTTYARLWERLKKGPHKPKDVGEILALIAKDAPEYQGPEAEGETRGPIGPKGRLSPNERGTLFHAVMEESDCSFEPGRYQSELKKKAKALNLCPTEEELRFLAEKAMEFQECEIGRLLRKAHEQKLPVFHEWTVWYLLEKDEYGFGPVYLNGSIDLFFLDAQGKGYLVDYKIARESHEPRYKRQLELYAMAIRESGIAQELTTILWYPKP